MNNACLVMNVTFYNEIRRESGLMQPIYCMLLSLNIVSLDKQILINNIYYSLKCIYTLVYYTLINI